MNRMHRRRLCIAAGLAWGLAAAASAQTLYKNVMPDGRIIYTDAPLPGAVQSKMLEPPAPPTQAQREAAQKRVEEDNRKREALQGRIEERRKIFDAADERVMKARRAVDQAQLALEQGRAPQGGEMSGNAGGGVRPNEDYFRRISDLERALTAARKELDDALRARNDAR
jgi:type IV secretory pathway VirB10-like protein